MPRIAAGKSISTFLSGALSLSASMVVVKIIGLFYKIPMLSLIGGEGMGYFNSAYEIYSLLCIVSITGLPVAMAVIISHMRDKSDADGVFLISKRAFSIIGLVFTAAMIILSHRIAVGLRSEKAYYCILAISPSLFFVCISSAYKGYFQGLSNMTPICVSSIIEAATKLILGLLLCLLGRRMGLEVNAVAALAILAITVGSVISWFYFVIYKKGYEACQGKTKKAPMGVAQQRRILLDIIKISLPCTASSLMISAVRIVDMTMILRRLQDIGYTSEVANEMYGSYSTMAIPIFSLASALVSSLIVPLIPELSREVALGNVEGQGEKISCAMALTMYVSSPAMIGISLFSGEILALLFKNQLEGILLVTPLLSFLGLSVVSSVLISLTGGMLQAYKKATLPVVSMAIGCVIKTALSFVLIGNKDINILGAPIGTLFCDIVICLLNFVFLFRGFKGRISFKNTVLQPFFCSVLAIVPVFFVMRMIEGRVGVSRVLTLVSIALSVFIYFILAFKKIIKIKDLV